MTTLKFNPAERIPFASRHRTQRVSAVLGIALGVSFTVCFITGLYSHFVQHPTSWFPITSRPAGLYRFTQGTHVVSGLASIPLLFAKLWTVFPKLFTWPPFRSIAHALERALLLPLVGGSLFLLYSGVNNINGRYPYTHFDFPEGHYWAAWITVGALLVHGGTHARTARLALRTVTPEAATHDPNDAPTSRERREVLGLAFGTSALITLFTIGQTLRPFSKLALIAPRRSDTGPQGFPVNRTAARAGVDGVDIATYRLRVHGRGIEPTTFTYEQLLALTSRDAELPIACVEGWSSTQRWTGVSVRDLLAAAGIDEPRTVTVRSILPRATPERPRPRRPNYGTSEVHHRVVADRDTLLAYRVGGEPLHPDHGYPLRLIAPNRPGVMQTKWINEIEVHQ